jgi:hypothetical protein
MLPQKMYGELLSDVASSFGEEVIKNQHGFHQHFLAVDHLVLSGQHIISEFLIKQNMMAIFFFLKKAYNAA